MNIHILSRIAKRLGVSKQFVSACASGRAPWPEKYRAEAQEELALWKAEALSLDIKLGKPASASQ